MRISSIYSKWPLKVRLSVILVLVSCVISYIMYDIMHDSLHLSLSREENDFLYDRLHTLRAIINGNPDYLAIIKKDIDWEGEHVPLPYYYLRILDSGGRGLIAMPGMEKQLPATWFPSPAASMRSTQKDLVRQAQNGRYYLLMSDSVVPPHQRDALTIQIALDITSEVRIDHGVHQKLLLVVTLRSVIFALIIIHIVQRLLKPLDEMVALSELITANKIYARASGEGWPPELRRLAFSFNAMLDRLQDAFSRMSQFASNMAHEIRTPLNNIMGEAEVALSKERSADEYCGVLSSVVEEGERLTQLISSLLFLAHAENAKDVLKRVAFETREAIEEVVSFYGPRIEEKGAVVTCSGTAKLNGDPLLFRQAVGNLLRNALNYSPEGVEVAFSVAAGEQGLQVTVNDTGYGIPEEDLVRIFDRFYRGDRARSNHTEGSGLGLAIVKAIMELHGGTVSVASRRGEGTTFTLNFPPGSSLPL